ncbi:MAG: hypothetical protein KIS67_13705 [Verrucomicrobiae bacterium]|nr:hypothetical protein [Verrucomicrobiae bacterium]
MAAFFNFTRASLLFADNQDFTRSMTLDLATHYTAIGQAKRAGGPACWERFAMLH